MELDDAMALSLMKKMHPSVQPWECEQAILNRKRVLDKAIDEDPWEFIASEDVEEVMCPSDRRVVKERTEQFNKLKAKRKVERAAIRAKTCKLYKVKDFGPPVDPQRGAKKRVATADRWWNSITGDPDFIVEHKPGPARLFTDQWNGRFRLSYPGEKPKSVSWTVKGQRAASLEALRQMWAWHTARTGQEPPIPLDVEA